MPEKSRYSAGRAIASIFLIIGVIYVIIGGIGLVLGISEMGGSSTGAFMVGGGLFAIFAGFTTVILCQVAVAIFDIADTGGIGNSVRADTATLGIAPSRASTVTSEAVDGRAHQLIGRNGKTYTASERDDGTFVMDTLAGSKTFDSIKAAQDYIR